MTKITNKSTGVRGINAKTGQVWINPGETVEADVEAAVLKRLEAHPDLTVEKGKAKAEKPDQTDAEKKAAADKAAADQAAKAKAAADEAAKAKADAEAAAAAKKA